MPRPPARRRWPRLALRVALATAVLAHATFATALAATRLVQPGDTLSEIAASYGVPLAELVAANGIADPDLILAGATLTIPDGAAGARADGALPTPAGEYRVEPGDTLSGIAARLGTSVAALLAANPAIVAPDELFAGQVLAIPAGESPVAALLRDAALEYGLDPALVQAIAWQESGWRQDLVSPAGARGVMQVLPETAAWVERDIVGRPLDAASNAADNVIAGTALFAWLLERAGDGDLALAYYVQGQGSVARDGIYPETRSYIANVRAIQRYIARHGGPPP
jgi:N-acetylmuramoyl-L-alanine amidase